MSASDPFRKSKDRVAQSGSSGSVQSWLLGLDNVPTTVSTTPPPATAPEQNNSPTRQRAGNTLHDGDNRSQGLTD
jgi:hypothetical protein